MYRTIFKDSSGTVRQAEKQKSKAVYEMKNMESILIFIFDLVQCKVLILYQTGEQEIICGFFTIYLQSRPFKGPIRKSALLK